jgi:hypothetical protein
MPSAANITVKKNDDTTDVVYTLKSPSAGENAPAIWRNDTVGTAINHRPELRVSFRQGSDGKSRQGRATFVYPEIATNTTTGVTSVVDKSSFALDFRLSQNMAAASTDECVSQFFNLLDSVLVKDCFKQGVSAA